MAVPAFGLGGSVFGKVSDKENCNAMGPRRTDSAEVILKDTSGDVAKIRKMGISDYAIITYVVRVQEGQSTEVALRGLLQGRSLSKEQAQFVRTVLGRFKIR